MLLTLILLESGRLVSGTICLCLRVDISEFHQVLTLYEFWLVQSFARFWPSKENAGFN
jgi:hypothetical protein